MIITLLTLLPDCCRSLHNSDKDAEQKLSATRQQQRQEREERERAQSAAWAD
jgi:hypothetical protein